MKIYEYELKFHNAWDNALDEIQYRGNSGNPLTLKEVLEFGFNNIYFENEQGYDVDDFSSDSLNKKVVFDNWDYDADEFRYIVVKEYEK